MLLLFYRNYSDCFWYLSNLSFSEFPRPVAWCLTLIWGKVLSHYCLKYFFCFFMTSYGSAITSYITSFAVVPETLNILFFYFFLWSVYSQAWMFLLRNLQLRDFFLSCVIYFNKSIKGIFNFCYSAFLFLAFFISLY
jgi:hypothetical protein